MAGEIGHMVVEPDGALCNCGAHGCLETIVGGRGIIQQAITAELFPTDVPFTAHHVYQAAQEGNREYLGRAVQWLILTYDVEKVVFGGGVTGAGEAFLQPLLQTLSRLQVESSLGSLFSAEKIALLPAGYNAGLWGAVHLAQEAVSGRRTAVAVPAIFPG
jgi:predicted NBD/HSP70 family sugar kinase